MYPVVRKLLWAGAGAAWAVAAVNGFSRLWRYDSAAGAPAEARQNWPADSRVGRSRDLPTLVMLLHPHCPCSRASVEELAKLMARCTGRLVARVVMLRPAGVPDGWEQTDLWRSAAAIPGVTVTADPQGIESQRLGAATSGQTLLYSESGELLFAGGITESRGHSGDNAGRSIVEALALHEVERAHQPYARTPVYGCPLFDRNNACANVGTSLCSK